MGKIIVLLSLTLLPLHAFAGNDDSVLIGDEAAMTGGAVTATVNSGAGLWYNPAGIVGVDKTTLDVSGSLYTVRFHRTPTLLEARSGATASGNNTEIVIIPTTLTFVRPLSDKWRFGLGVFAAESSDSTLRTDFVAPKGGGVESRWLFSLNERETRYHIVVGLGGKISDKLRIGVGLQAMYYTGAGNLQFAGALTDTNTGMSDEFLVEAIDATFSNIGLGASAGVQWLPTENISLGLSVTSPVMGLYSSLEAPVIVVENVAGQGFADALNVKDSGAGFDMLLPTRIRLGAAFGFGKSRLAVDGDIQHGIAESDFGTRELVWNARLGFTHDISETFRLGVGAFTDRSSASEVEAFLDSKLDFYGGTVGISFQDDKRVEEGKSLKNMLFGTTIALRYAYGSGQTGGLLLDDDFAFDPIAEDQAVDYSVHEIGIYLGTSLKF